MIISKLAVLLCLEYRDLKLLIGSKGKINGRHKLVYNGPYRLLVWMVYGSIYAYAYVNSMCLCILNVYGFHITIRAGKRNILELPVVLLILGALARPLTVNT